jgi:anti-sigma factor (TIGR02949 family)
MNDVTRMNCEQAFARLDDYLDRELSQEDLAGVKAHLEFCAHCAMAFDFEAEVLARIRSKVRSVPVPEELKRNVVEALRREP